MKLMSNCSPVGACALELYSVRNVAATNTGRQDALSAGDFVTLGGERRQLPGLKGSTIRITPPGDTRGSGRRARPFVRPALGSPPEPGLVGCRPARQDPGPDAVSRRRSARRTPRALVRGADDRRSGRGRGTRGARSARTAPRRHSPCLLYTSDAADDLTR